MSEYSNIHEREILVIVDTNISMTVNKLLVSCLGLPRFRESGLRPSAGLAEVWAQPHGEERPGRGRLSEEPKAFRGILKNRGSQDKT